jgi:hypothetical protein
MLRRFEDGVLVFCDVCRSYEQMRPREVYPKLVALGVSGVK